MANGLLNLTDDPQTLGLLSLGLRLMSTPGKFGTALGQSGLGAMDDVLRQTQLLKEQKRRDEMARMQQEEFAARKAEAERQQQQAQMRDAYLASVGGQMGPPEPVTVPGALRAGLGAQELSLMLPKPRESMIGKVDPKDYTPESLRAFLASGDPSMLRAAEKAPELTNIEKLQRARDALPVGSAPWKEIDAQIRAIGTPSGTTVTLQAPQWMTTPDGQVVPVQTGNKPGAPPQIIRDPATGKPFTRPTDGKEKDLTEAQAKASTFLGQMRSASSTLEKIGADQTALSMQAETALAGGPMNIAIREKAQRVRQSQDQWSEAYLRFKTGAATTPAEISNNRRTFFPVLGDSPEVIAQKKAMRKQAEADMAIAAGRGAVILNERDAKTKKQVVRTGTLNGRKVVQYKDGSTEYAD